MLTISMMWRIRTLSSGTRSYNHPVHGGIVCLVATDAILAGEEVYADYLYDLEDQDTEQWYKELYARTYHQAGAEEGGDE